MCETIVIFYLFGSLWDQWQLSFKIVTPLLHCAFSATQVHGSRIFFMMWKKQRRMLEEKANESIESEANLGVAETLNENREVIEEKKATVTVAEVHV